MSFQFLVVLTLSFVSLSQGVLAAENVTTFRCQAPRMSKESFEFRVENLDNLKKAKLVNYKVGDSGDDYDFVSVLNFDKNGKNMTDSTDSFIDDFSCFNGQRPNFLKIKKNSNGAVMIGMDGDCDGMTYFQLRLYGNSGFTTGYLSDTGSETTGYSKVSCKLTQK